METNHNQLNASERSPQITKEQIARVADNVTNLGVTVEQVKRVFGIEQNDLPKMFS